MFSLNVISFYVRIVYEFAWYLTRWQRISQSINIHWNYSFTFTFLYPIHIRLLKRVQKAFNMLSCFSTLIMVDQEGQSWNWKWERKLYARFQMPQGVSYSFLRSSFSLLRWYDSAESNVVSLLYKKRWVGKFSLINYVLLWRLRLLHSFILNETAQTIYISQSESHLLLLALVFQDLGPLETTA